MQDYNILLTWEAIYDVTDITDYIEAMFGQDRADRFQNDMKMELQKLSYMATMFPQTQIFYRNYSIHKKPFPPSIIFYVLMEETKEVHVLRVLREDRDWEHILSQKQNYTYPN